MAAAANVGVTALVSFIAARAIAEAKAKRGPMALLFFPYFMSANWRIGKAYGRAGWPPFAAK